MLAGALAMVASAVLAARATTFVEFAFAESLAALSMALCSGADTAYLFDLLRSHDRVGEYPKRESTASAFHLLGSAIAFAGGGVLAQIDLVLPYYVTALVAAAAALVACSLREERVAGPADRGAPVLGAVLTARTWTSQIAAAFADVARSPRLLWIIGYSAVVFVLLRATIYLYQPYLEQRGLALDAIGFLFAGVYVIAAIVASSTYRLRRLVGDDLLAWGMLAVLAVSFVGLAGAGAGPWMLALLIVQAIANGIYSPLTKPLLNAEIVDSRRRAAVLSVDSMVRRAAMGVFAPLAGLYGQADVMLLCGAVGLGGAILLGVAAMSRAASADPR